MAPAINSCSRCGGTSILQALISGAVAYEFHQVFECGACGKIDWKSFQIKAPNPPVPADRRSIVAA